MSENSWLKQKREKEKLTPVALLWEWRRGEMRFSLIFQGSYTIWIFIWAGRQGCELCFIWPLTDYPFVNISHHFPFSKPKGGMGIVTSTNTKHEDRSQIECRTSLPARCDTELWSTTGGLDTLPNGIKWSDHFCRTCREQAPNSHPVLANVILLSSRPHSKTISNKHLNKLNMI